jgi:hypothetical protein
MMVRWCDKHKLSYEYDGQCPLCVAAARIAELEVANAALREQAAADAPYTEVGRRVCNMKRGWRLVCAYDVDEDMTVWDCGPCNYVAQYYDVDQWGESPQEALDAAGVTP